MRYYVVDELIDTDIAKIKTKLDSLKYQGSIEGIYYIPVPDDCLCAEQKEHQEKCGPFFMALEVEDKFIQIEMLVRARQIIRCSCVSYATPEARAHVLQWMDSILAELEINH